MFEIRTTTGDELKIVVVVGMMAGSEGVTGGVGAASRDFPTSCAAEGELGAAPFARSRSDFPALGARGMTDETAWAESEGIRLARVGAVEELGLGTGKGDSFAVRRDVSDVTGVAVGVGGMGGFVADFEKVVKFHDLF